MLKQIKWKYVKCFIDPDQQSKSKKSKKKSKKDRGQQQSLPPTDPDVDEVDVESMAISPGVTGSMSYNSVPDDDRNTVSHPQSTAVTA